MRTVSSAFLLVASLGLAACGGGASDGNVTCMATFSGSFSGTSACTSTAVYASATRSTAMAFSGTIAGSTETWSGVSFNLAGMPAVSNYVETDLLDVAGGIDSGTGDMWTLAGGSGAATMTGSLRVDLSSVTIATMEMTGDIYTLHGTATATLAYMGSRGGTANENIDLTF